MSFSKIFLILFPVLLFSACASTPDQQAGQTPEAEAYKQAMEEVSAGRYETGLMLLEDLKKKADSDQDRNRIDVSIAYTQYKKGDFEQARNTCDQILSASKKGDDVSYVYYLQGLIASGQGNEKLEPLMQAMAVNARYPDELREAYQIFSTLVQDYPESAYTDDAVRRTEDLRKQLAEFELHITRAELVQGDFDGVIRHARYINEYFDEPEVRKAALILMKKAYEQSGRPEDAERVSQQINNLVVPSDY